MNPYFLGLLFILASVGLFFLLNFYLIRPLIRLLLNRPFSQFFLNYLRSNTKLQFDVATEDKNPDRAWAEMVFAKVYEMGVSRVPYSKRELNLKYIKNSSLVNRKLADELIKVLPKQSGNSEFQKRLARFICELLSKVENIGDIEKNRSVASISQIIIIPLGTAVAAWVAGGVYLVLSLIYTYEKFSPLALLLINLTLFILLSLPLIGLIFKGLVKFTVLSAIATVMILGLGGYASFVHGKIISQKIDDLSLYQNPGANLLLRYPEWLTMNNKECNGKKISVLAQGQMDTPIIFRVDDDQFYFKNKDCVEIIPQLDPSFPTNQAFEFYIVARDDAPFYSEIKSVTVIPQYISGASVVDFSDKEKVIIKLENWFWNSVSNLYLLTGSIGVTVAFYVVNIFLNKRTH